MHMSTLKETPDDGRSSFYMTAEAELMMLRASVRYGRDTYNSPLQLELFMLETHTEQSLVNCNIAFLNACYSKWVAV